MSRGVNKVILVGNLGQKPEMRYTQTDSAVANLSLATSESWREKNSGEKQERTQWHNISILSDPLVNIAERFLKKGSKVYLEGQLETRKWQDNSGSDRYSTEIVLRPYKGEITLIDNKADSNMSSESIKNDQMNKIQENSESKNVDELDNEKPY